jgi:hypothetical protein
MQQHIPTPLTDDYLQALEGLRPADLPPYFYTRLRARMERNGVEPAGFRWRPALAVAVLGLVLALNTVALLQQRRPSGPAAPQKGALESFASDFDLYTTSNY